MARYKIYATLLDAFQRYLQSPDEDALQVLLDKINRMPFTSEAADRGTAFNELVDKAKLHPEIITPDVTIYEFTNRQGESYAFSFKSSVVQQFVDRFKKARHQIYTEGIIYTSYGEVLLYGYMDEVLRNFVYDIKTTSNYSFPKYLHAWQHIVYPYCMEQTGIFCDGFEYTVTDFSSIYTEQYFFKPERDIPRLVSICDQLIEFLENFRHLITDKKVFAMDEIPTQC